MNRWRGVKDLVRDAVDQGATAVERVHLATTAMPFAALRRIPPLDAPVETVQKLHDAAISGTYGMVRWVNRAVGATLDVALDLHEKNQASTAKGERQPE